MLFNSLIFVLFLAVVLILHYLPLPWKVKKLNLCAASYIFYAAWKPLSAILLWISALYNRFADRLNANVPKPGAQKVLPASCPARQSILFLLILCIPIFFRAPNAAAWNISFTMENDFFGSAGTDRYYTNGFNITVVEEEYAEWFNALARASYQHGRNGADWRRVSYTSGQDIYTPQDIERQELIKNDRPYAGWLYLGMGIHDRSPVSGTEQAVDKYRWQTQDSTEFILGMIGPQSYAGEVQYWWHEKVIGFSRTRKPSGWDNQLDNEPAFVLLRERKWRTRRMVTKGVGLEVDLIPHLSAAVGTVTTYAAAGAEARLGWNLPDDFGSAKNRAGLSPSRIASPLWKKEGAAPFSFLLFGKLEGRAVLRDIFLDGNTFTESHSVDRNPLVYSVVTGASLLVWNRYEIIFSHVYQSKEFEGQPLSHIYGALTLSCYW